jgi:hypothetical protein
MPRYNSLFSCENPNGKHGSFPYSSHAPPRRDFSDQEGTATIRERGCMLVKQLSVKQDPQKAKPISNKGWTRILRATTAENRRRLIMWSRLGWRRTQFQLLEYASYSPDSPHIKLITPPGKGAGAGGAMPTTTLRCRCQLYSTSYKRHFPGAVCSTCTTAIPNFDRPLSTKPLEDEACHSHSMRRTLALCITLCIREFHIPESDALTKRINTRLQWLSHGTTDPSPNLSMLRYYAHDMSQYEWDFFPQDFKTAALEICAPDTASLITSPNGTIMLLCP